MKYYTLVIKIYNDGTEDKTSLYTFATLDEAVASFHKALGGAIGESVIASIMAQVINSVGVVHKTEYWAASTTVDETEETATTE